VHYAIIQSVDVGFLALAEQSQKHKRYQRCGIRPCDANEDSPTA
jgi:hypothetical protein